MSFGSFGDLSADSTLLHSWDGASSSRTTSLLLFITGHQLIRPPLCSRSSVRMSGTTMPSTNSGKGKLPKGERRGWSAFTPALVGGIHLKTTGRNAKVAIWRIYYHLQDDNALAYSLPSTVVLQSTFPKFSKDRRLAIDTISSIVCHASPLCHGLFFINQAWLYSSRYH